MWSQMTDSDKKPYLDMSDRDKARYAQEMKNYGARGKDHYDDYTYTDY